MRLRIVWTQSCYKNVELFFKSIYHSFTGILIQKIFFLIFRKIFKFHGFSLGVSDILVTLKADAQRKSLIEELRACGDSVVQKAFSLPEDTSFDKIRYTLASTYNHPRDREMVKMVDFSMKQAINKYAEQINRLFFIYLGLFLGLNQNLKLQQNL